MFHLYAEKNKLSVRGREAVTSGSVNVYPVQFGFSADWDGLSRTVVFKAVGGEPVSVLLDGTGECVIPWEVLKKPGPTLMVGVYGSSTGGEIVLPTVWANLGIILEGAAPSGESAQPPTPDLWQQELARKGDGLDYTPEGALGLYAGDKLLSSVPIQGGGEGGVSDHRLLTHREDENQHPISSIIHLEEKLDAIPTAMTAEELRKILMT